MGKYCGASIPTSHISSSKEIMVHFETDDYNGHENGFKMEYNPTGKQNTPIQNNTKYHSQISASNKILIHFQSDGSATRAGFKMEYNPLGNTSIQNNTKYHRDRCRIIY
jgi:hypothetical protein